MGGSWCSIATPSPTTSCRSSRQTDRQASSKPTTHSFVQRPTRRVTHRRVRISSKSIQTLLKITILAPKFLTEAATRAEISPGWKQTAPSSLSNPEGLCEVDVDLSKFRFSAVYQLLKAGMLIPMQPSVTTIELPPCV